MADVLIIGGGIVGLATGLQLLERQPDLKVVLLEKEAQLAGHQTGHNSGVIHSGIYYRPGSLKAKNCVEGAQALKRFCDQENIPYQLCGKVIVATAPEELPRLYELEERGRANGVAGLVKIGPERLKEIEPYANGIQALYSPNTGIVDYLEVARAYGRRIERLGGEILCSERVTAVREVGGKILVTTSSGEYMTSMLVNCAGLHSDRIARMIDGGQMDAQIVPFRGEYYGLVSEKQPHLKGLIYPVPDPKFPFLGVHLTRRIDGAVEAGPNAVLAMAREGYSKAKFSPADCLRFLGFPGFWRMAARYWRVGLYELRRSFSTKTFLRDLQRLMPSLILDDLTHGGAGVRAQVVRRDGTLCDDFLMIERSNRIHVLNAPSPAATASLAIGGAIAEKAIERLGVIDH